MIKVKIHSSVDVITNSSTVIYTYQNSTKQAKELVEEMLKLAGITDKSPDDIFYYGVFLDDYDRYIENEENNMPSDLSYDDQQKWGDNVVMQVLKGEIEKPKWMGDSECDYDDYEYPNVLHLLAKEEKYKIFGEKIRALLCSVGAEEGPQ